MIAVTAAVCARVRAAPSDAPAEPDAGSERWVPCCDLHEWVEDLHTSLETLQQVLGERIEAPPSGGEPREPGARTDWYV